jgi:hypothetical protein
MFWLAVVLPTVVASLSETDVTDRFPPTVTVLPEALERIVQPPPDGPEFQTTKLFDTVKFEVMMVVPVD